MTTVGLVAAGDMGAALGKVLTDNGATVVTCLEGRSAATAARASAAGMRGVGWPELAAADIVLSVLPPGQALAFARSLAPWLATAAARPPFVECNPLSPAAIGEIEAVLVAAGAPFIDGSIIGLTPRPGNPGPAIYVSGPAAGRAELLLAHGLRIRRLDAPVGAASALKLSYAAITKGLFGIASAAILAAERSDIGAALHAELSASQPAMMASLARGIPDMFTKTGRWVAEMEAISDHFGAERDEGAFYAALARFYGRLDRDFAGAAVETAALDAFFASHGQPKP